MSNPSAAAECLWNAAGLPRESLSNLKLTGDPNMAVDSSFNLGAAAQTTIGLAGLAAAQFHQLQTGEMQHVSVDARHAVTAFKSEAYYAIDGQRPIKGIWDNLAGIYQTKDNRYVRLHTNWPHHRQGLLDVLGCKPTKDAVASALSQWNSVDFETEASSRKMVATALRSFVEWDNHPQGNIISTTPPVTLTKVGDAPKRDARDKASRPLEGIRVLDLIRVLAGPVCGRTLAAHGADVLLITSPNLPSLPPLDVDTSRGKRTTQLDLTAEHDRETLSSLVEDADVFLQAYRPGGLSAKGFGVEEVVKRRPGIVYASLTAYGWEGPWKDRRGYDSLVQTAIGFNAAEAQAYATFTDKDTSIENIVPKAFPMQALDHAAGYLLAFGINAALCKTITEGGSWEVRLSLAAVGQWIRSLGRIDPGVAFGSNPTLPLRDSEEIEALSVEVQRSQGDGPGSGQGSHMDGKRQVMKTIKHPAILSKTPVVEGEAPFVLNAHSAKWLQRE